MKLWQDLISTAIVGTDRQKLTLPADNGEFAEFFQNFQNDAGEIALLKAAAIVGTYRRTGTKSTADNNPSPTAAPPETAAFISKQSEQHLATMLAGNQSDVLAEFLELAAQRRRVLPPQFLPQILELGGSKQNLRMLLPPVVGSRGKWLAKHNADWRWALTQDETTEIWQNGTRGERFQALSFLRQQNPAAARDLFNADWKSEAAADRAYFLKTLQTNLSLDDEAFLAEVLKNDKSTEVRRTAFDLLISLPDSNLVKQMTERATALLTYKKGGVLSKAKLEINFPKDFEKEAKDDVLNNLELYLNERELGKKAVKLLELLHCAPPSFWEKHFSASCENIVEAAVESDWKTALLNGFKSAAVNFADEKWLISVLPYNGQNEYYSLCNQIKRTWTSRRIEELVLLLLEGKTKINISLTFASQLLRGLDNAWSAEFTDRVFRFLQNYVRAKSVFDAGFFTILTNNLLSCGQFVDSTFLEKFDELSFRKILEYSDDKSEWREKFVADFISVVRFRQEMYAAFNNEE